jgi:formylmethanofuran dehydrogenase subunit E
MTRTVTCDKCGKTTTNDIGWIFGEIDLCQPCYEEYTKIKYNAGAEWLKKK